MATLCVSHRWKTRCLLLIQTCLDLVSLGKAPGEQRLFSVAETRQREVPPQVLARLASQATRHPGQYVQGAHGLTPSLLRHQQLELLVLAL